MSQANALDRRLAEAIDPSGGVTHEVPDGTKVQIDAADVRQLLTILRGVDNVGRIAFNLGARECRTMLANFVEQGGDPVTANSMRLNWNPSWGPDPDKAVG